MKVVQMAPAVEKLDPLVAASDELLGEAIILRFEHFGWCIGELKKKNTDKRRKIDGKMVNFIAKFEIDEGTTEVSLQVAEYDTSPDADYQSWLLLEPEAGPP